MTLHNTFGIAARNFTAYPEMPDMKALVDYGVKMEEMGFDSIWVWDHILLGVEPCFPVVDSLTLLTAIAARTKKIKLSTGILVLPLRNPVVLAKQLSSMDQLSDGRLLMAFAVGWYKREFDAVGVPFEQPRQDHGREPRRAQALLDRAHGQRRLAAPQDSRWRHVSEARAAAAAADPHRRLCRRGAQARRGRRRRLAHLFLQARRVCQVVGEGS